MVSFGLLMVLGTQMVVANRFFFAHWWFWPIKVPCPGPLVHTFRTFVVIASDYQESMKAAKCWQVFYSVLFFCLDLTFVEQYTEEVYRLCLWGFKGVTVRKCLLLPLVSSLKAAKCTYTYLNKEQNWNQQH